MARLSSLLGLLLLLGVATQANAGAYFNSAETGCDGSDNNVLFCDDFEKDQSGNAPGNWYPENCDTANGNGGIDSRAKGWCGTIYANPITPAGAVDCTGSIGALGTCAATSGTLGGGVGGRNMAWHFFSPSHTTEVSELWVRWYYRASAGYSWSGQKILDFNHGDPREGGIMWAGFGYNLGSSLPSTNPPSLAITNNRLHADTDHCGSGAAGKCQQNQGNDFSPTAGQWSFYEVHIKLNTVPGTNGVADGVLELWAMGCGASLPGSCTGAPTLRMRYTNVDFGWRSNGVCPDPNESQLYCAGGIGSLWFENWGNTQSDGGSTGQEWYDNIRASKAGPIGYVGEGGGGGDTTAPTVTITAPTATGTYSTQQAALAVGGSASDNVGVSSVTWTNDRGGSGTATGTTSWSQAAVPLLLGVNVITVTSHDAAGNTQSATLTVTRIATPNPGSHFTIIK